MREVLPRGADEGRVSEHNQLPPRSPQLHQYVKSAREASETVFVPLTVGEAFESTPIQAVPCGLR